MSSLMDSVTNWITPELTSSLASRFGIPADTVNSSLQTSSAAMLTTLANKAHDSNFLSSIYKIITGSGTAAAAAATAGSIHAAAQPEVSSNFLTTLFGSHLTDVETKVAHSANIPLPAGAAVMSSAAPLVMGALSNKINAGGLSMAALGSALAAELPSLHSYLPAGFAIPGLAGVGAAASSTAASASASAHRAAAATVAETKSSSGWLWPVVLLGALLIAGLIWYFNRGTATNSVSDAAGQATTAVSNTASQVGSAAQNALTTLGAFFKRKLPDGTELNIPEHGIENKLIAFIEDKSQPADKETWFDFDRLLFATGSATLEPSSKEQLQNVASIMKAYPNVHLRIGGYTDNTGDPNANLKLSQERASTVMTQLTTMGVDPSRLDARGYGEEHPVADNGTEAGRAQNRRISVRVTQK